MSLHMLLYTATRITKREILELSPRIPNLQLDLIDVAPLLDDQGLFQQASKLAPRLINS